MGGTAFLAVLKRAMDVQNGGGLSHPQGGAGGLVAVLAKAAEAAGVKTRLNARAVHFLFDGGRLAGVELANGEAIYAPHVVSSLDARHTLLKMGAERDLPLGFKRRLHGFRSQGSVAKVNLALSALPNFKGLDRRFLKDRLLVCPSLDYLETSFAACGQGAFASDLAMEITVPTFHDATLARPGHHVMSINVMYVPRTLASGSWENAKGDLLTMIASKLRQFAPELPDQVEGAQVFTPDVLEAMGGGAGNHWHGGDLSMDQLGIFRPIAGASRTATPVPGLYLCGAGTHPCGGATGTNGRIAAEAVLAQLGQAS
jgi:phytoene dehydrogenase-like protein